nr:GNAT family N-acetyltransferase [Halobacillus sp. A5]
MFEHFHNPYILQRYDSNFLQFKRMPELSEFTGAYEYLHNFHFERGLHHVKFCFPQNEKPGEELCQFFKQFEMSTGSLELYQIQPEQFPEAVPHNDIQVETVNSLNFPVFSDLHYHQDLEFGAAFAKQKVEFNKKLFRDPDIEMVLAYYKGIPAGSVTAIRKKGIVEIDHLVVEDHLQRKGIGTRLQQHVMKQFPDSTIILVADGNDSVRDMYRKQNYQFKGFQVEAQKID